MKTIMILGAGQFQKPVIQLCNKLGYKVIATDINNDACGLKYADIALNISTLDKEEILKAAIEYNTDAILTTSDYPVRTTAYVCENLGLPGLNIETSKICTNKFLQREHLRKNDIPTPNYFTMKALDDINDNIANISFPLIVKPVDSSASRGVVKVTDIAELIDAFIGAIKYSKSNQVIVEEFIEGPEFSVESLTQNGETYIIAITEKTTSGAPYCIEEKHVIPANLSYEEKESIKELVKRVIKVINIDNSASHIEVKLTDKGPMIIEIGTRLGGDYITSDLVPLATGVDMVHNIIRIAFGEALKINKSIKLYAGIQFITPINYDKEINNIESIKNNDNLIRFEVKENDINNDFKSSFDRLGYYIVKANTREELYNILDRKDYNKN